MSKIKWIVTNPNSALETPHKFNPFTDRFVPVTMDSVVDDVWRECGLAGDGELLFDPVDIASFYQEAEQRLAMDALTSQYGQIDRKMLIMQKVMLRASGVVKPVEGGMKVSDPFKKNGVTQVAAIFELSDGQTIAILFHNPDTTPKKLATTDEMVSWKWLLNKTDVTITVAPEGGADVDIKKAASRLMQLAEKNSKRFTDRQTKNKGKIESEGALKDAIANKEGELAELLKQIDGAKAGIDAGVAPASENNGGNTTVNEFTPTHTLRDGTPVKATDEAGVYEDANGDQHDDSEAEAISANTKDKRFREFNGIKPERNGDKWYAYDFGDEDSVNEVSFEVDSPEDGKVKVFFQGANFLGESKAERKAGGRFQQTEVHDYSSSVMNDVVIPVLTRFSESLGENKDIAEEPQPEAVPETLGHAFGGLEKALTAVGAIVANDVTKTPETPFPNNEPAWLKEALSIGTPRTDVHRNLSEWFKRLTGDTVTLDSLSQGEYDALKADVAIALAGLPAIADDAAWKKAVMDVSGKMVTLSMGVEVEPEIIDDNEILLQSSKTKLEYTTDTQFIKIDEIQSRLEEILSKVSGFVYPYQVVERNGSARAEIGIKKERGDDDAHYAGETHYVAFYYKGKLGFGEKGEFFKSYRKGNGKLSSEFINAVSLVESAFAKAGVAVVDSGGNPKDVKSMSVDGNDSKPVEPTPEPQPENSYSASTELSRIPSAAAIKAMPEKKYQKLYEKLEDENYHSLNLVLEARRYGDDALVAEAENMLALKGKLDLLRNESDSFEYETKEWIDADSRRKTADDAWNDARDSVTSKIEEAKKPKAVEPSGENAAVTDPVNVEQEQTASEYKDEQWTNELLRRGFAYGLRHRPYEADPQLASKVKRIEVIQPDDLIPSLKSRYGDDVRHGILITDNKLSPEVISQHELVEIHPNDKMDGNNEWGSVLKSVDYLVSKGKKDAYLTTGFFNNAKVSQDKFNELLAESNTGTADDLWNIRLKRYNAIKEEEAFQNSMKEDSPSVVENPHIATLQAIVNGDMDSKPLSEVETALFAAADALEAAGLSEQYDDLIGKAAEKYAELDQKANG